MKTACLEESGALSVVLISLSALFLTVFSKTIASLACFEEDSPADI